MGTINCKTLGEIKSAISLGKDIIVVEGRSEVAEAVNYFKTLKLEKMAGNIGIVVGFYAFSPIFWGGIGEKIIHSKYRKYVYFVSDDMKKCVVIRKEYFINILKRFPGNMVSALMDAQVSEEDIEVYLQMNKKDIRRVLRERRFGAIIKDKNFRVLSQMANYCSGKGIVLEIDEIFKLLSFTNSFVGEEI